MKIIILLFIVLFTACGKTRHDCDGFYVIKNNTSMNLNVSTYKDSVITKIIPVAAHSTFENRSGNEGVTGMPDELLMADSAIIVFDNQKQIVFTQSTSISLPNILLPSEYFSDKTDGKCVSNNRLTYDIGQNHLDQAK